MVSELSRPAAPSRRLSSARPAVCCRSCDRADPVPILSLGQTALANALLTEDQLGDEEPTYPLDVVFCPECTLVQITETVPPEQLFRDYVYFSSFSDAMVQHARELSQRLIRELHLDSGSLVIEVASNDGYLLQHYKAAGVPVLGIEPARNVAEVAIRERGIPTLTEFFGTPLALRLNREGVRADVIHAHNVLAHVADLNGVVAGLRQLLKPSGVAIIEVPYVRDLIDGCEFDTIYHEHLCYFSLTALERLFARERLRILDVERDPIHGGTLRLQVGHEDEWVRAGRVAELLRDEEKSGLTTPGYYGEFGRRIRDLKDELRGVLQDLKQAGKSIAAYGASAKGSTLLNYFGIGRETLDFVADRSTVKQGRFTPGTRLPIVAPEELLAQMPDYVLLLTWNFAEEILQQQAEYRRRGGRFIIPVPEVRVM